MSRSWRGGERGGVRGHLLHLDLENELFGILWADHSTCTQYAGFTGVPPEVGDGFQSFNLRAIEVDGFG